MCTAHRAGDSRKTQAEQDDVDYLEYRESPRAVSDRVFMKPFVENQWLQHE